MNARCGIAVAALLGTSCADRADPGQRWERAYRAEFAKSQFAAICHDPAFDGSRLRALRDEAARKGYSAVVRRIEREETEMRSKEFIACAGKDGVRH